MQDYAPKTFNQNPEGLTEEGLKIESEALLRHLSSTAEQMTPNDAIRLAQRLLVGVNAYGIQQTAVQKYVRKAIIALRGLSLA